MKITIELEVTPKKIIDPNLPEEIIISELKESLQFSMEPEIWIDTSDDGGGEFNIYEIKVV